MELCRFVNICGSSMYWGKLSNLVECKRKYISCHAMDTYNWQLYICYQGYRLQLIHTTCKEFHRSEWWSLKWFLHSHVILLFYSFKIIMWVVVMVTITLWTLVYYVLIFWCFWFVRLQVQCTPMTFCCVCGTLNQCSVDLLIVWMLMFSSDCHDDLDSICCGFIRSPWRFRLYLFSFINAFLFGNALRHVTVITKSNNCLTPDLWPLFFLPNLPRYIKSQSSAFPQFPCHPCQTRALHTQGFLFLCSGPPVISSHHWSIEALQHWNIEALKHWSIGICDWKWWLITWTKNTLLPPPPHPPPPPPPHPPNTEWRMPFMFSLTTNELDNIIMELHVNW